MAKTLLLVYFCSILCGRAARMKLQENFTELADEGDVDMQENFSYAQLGERMDTLDVPLVPAVGPDGIERYWYQQRMRGGLPADVSCPLYGFNTVLLNMGPVHDDEVHPMRAKWPLSKARYNEALDLFRHPKQDSYLQYFKGYLMTDMNVLEHVANYCLDIAAVTCETDGRVPTTVSEILACGSEHCPEEKGGLKQCGFTIKTKSTFATHYAGGWFEQQDNSDSASPEIWLADSMSEGPRVIGGVPRLDELSAYVWKGAEVTWVELYKPLHNAAAPCSDPNSEVVHNEGFCKLLRGQNEGFGVNDNVDDLGKACGFPHESLCHSLRPG